MSKRCVECKVGFVFGKGSELCRPCQRKVRNATTTATAVAPHTRAPLATPGSVSTGWHHSQPLPDTSSAVHDVLRTGSGNPAPLGETEKQLFAIPAAGGDSTDELHGFSGPGRQFSNGKFHLPPQF